MSVNLKQLFDKTSEEMKKYLKNVPTYTLIKLVKMTGEDYVGNNAQGLSVHLMNKHKPTVAVIDNQFYVESKMRCGVASDSRIERAVMILHLVCSQAKYKEF